MVESELRDLIYQISSRKCEEQTIEVKSANKGCTEKLYDTLSAFSNQNSGGIIVFGIDESQGFKMVGVYDAQDLQKKVMEYGQQMTPIVRPLFTVYSEDGLSFVSAEIPPIDISERPCFKTAKGRLQGSYIRVGDADKPMTEYEVYSYEAFRKKYRDDVREISKISLEDLDKFKLSFYVQQRILSRPNLEKIDHEQLYHLIGIKNNNNFTLASLLLFGIYPQAFFPQLSIIATAISGTEMGILDGNGQRFSDSQRIEGTLPEMLEASLNFVKRNIKVSTKIDTITGKRYDIPQYPMDAVREAILNALVHRDYSFHTEGMPIQLVVFSNRIEISNPGGLYGRMTVDQLGKMQPDTRNPVLVTAMEAIGQTENRYSGIPRIFNAMKEHKLPEPVFTDNRGTFTVCLYNSSISVDTTSTKSNVQDPKSLLDFCKVARSRDEIVEYIGVETKTYALKKYLDPLIDAGLIKRSIPDKPKSPNQTFKTVE